MNLPGQVFYPVTFRMFQNSGLRCRGPPEDALAASPLALAQPGVGPLEAGGQDVSDVREVEQEERHPDDGVEDSDELADLRGRSDVAVA